MPQFYVRHYSGSPMRGSEAKDVVGLFLQYPDNWPKVAFLECRDVEKAFELTNHIDKDWWLNPEVIAAKEPLNHRSTSVGDVIIEMDPNEREAPKIYVVMNAGMQLVPGNFIP